MSSTNKITEAHIRYCSTYNTVELTLEGGHQEDERLPGYLVKRMYCCGNYQIYLHRAAWNAILHGIRWKDYANQSLCYLDR